MTAIDTRTSVALEYAAHFTALLEGCAPAVPPAAVSVFIQPDPEDDDQPTIDVQVDNTDGSIAMTAADWGRVADNLGLTPNDVRVPRAPVVGVRACRRVGPALPQAGSIRCHDHVA